MSNSFMRHLFADTGWREHNPSLLHNLSKGPGPAEASLQPNSLPSADEAQDIFDTFTATAYQNERFQIPRGGERVPVTALAVKGLVFEIQFPCN